MVGYIEGYSDTVDHNYFDSLDDYNMQGHCGY